MTALDHCQNRFFGPCEYSFHRTVAAVADPAFNAEFKRSDLRPGAEADTLGVHGVLWRLTPRDLITLAAWENTGGGLYRTEIVPVRHAGRQNRALIYLARPCPLGRAKSGYMELLIAAALEWRLPQLYIDTLRGFLPIRTSGTLPPYGKAFRWR
jgi:hypothetical protein